MTRFFLEHYSEIKLGLVSLLPVLMAAVLYLLDTKTPFGRLNYRVKQVIFGVLFGAVAVFGTEYGIPMNGAQVNCRDAAVLTGGLMFGAPAGIIAGVIGGVERWIAVAWGVGTFTRVACSVSTVIAGLYAAALRKYMFENKKPGWLLSLAIGVVMEIFHLTMVFITNIKTPTEATAVVRACTAPMVLANGLSVMLASFVLSCLSVQPKQQKRPDGVRISQTIQRWLLVTVCFAFATTSFFVFRLQDSIAKNQRDSLLNLALNETVADINDASNQKLLDVTRDIADGATPENIGERAWQFGVDEASMIDQDGIIFASSVLEYIGFDMKSGAQAREFLCLLGDDPQTTEYVQEFGPITRDASIERKYIGISTETGCLQVGFSAEQLQVFLSEEVDWITKNRHVGETGSVMIFDVNYEVASAPESATDEELRNLAEKIPNLSTETVVKLNDGKTDCYVQVRRAEGYYILALLPVKEALQMRNIALYVNTFLEILVFAVLFALIYLLIKKVVVNKIGDINRSLAKITDGNLDEVVNVRTNAEFATLSDDINSTVDTLKHYIAEASARIDKELEFAKNIQESALPRTFPAYPKRKDFDIFASMDAAKEVGGDFYDFYLTDTDTLHFLIADVSGKGIPAAMFMMRAKTELKHLTESGRSLDEVFTQGNQTLCEGNDAGMFVTAWQGGLNLATGCLTYVNAGHNPPLICHADGKFEYLKNRPGFVLAGMDGIRYKTGEVQLAPGDTVYLYTDGVTEATNADNKLYGEERLLETVNACAYESAEELCRAVRKDVDEFVGDADQFDDITMVALRYIGQPEVPAIHRDNATLEDIPEITAFVEEYLEKIGCPMKMMMQFNVAIDEIYSNIVRYGYADCSGPVTVEIVEREEPRAIHLRFIDTGIPYNPLTKEDPDVTLSAEERGIGGLGIFMVKKTMDDVRYKFEHDQNILTITKFLD